ncbi:methionyl-tRNA formyltransferase, partial [Peptoniphilus genitalis]
MKNTREKALQIINDVLYKGTFLEESLEILKASNIDERDFAFIKEITTGVVRNKTYLDYVIRENSKVRFNRIHKIKLSILEMAIYQMYFLDKVPDYSIVDESVNLAKIYGNKGSISFTNGILRSISKEKALQVTLKNSIDNLSTYYSHPRFYTEYFYDNVEFIEQDEDKKTYASKILKNDLDLDFNDTSANIVNKIRGLSPHYGVRFKYDDKFYKIYKAEELEDKNDLEAGRIIKSDKELIIKTGDGAISVKEIQAPGKRAMGIDDFLRGNKFQENYVIGGK